MARRLSALNRQLTASGIDVARAMDSDQYLALESHESIKDICATHSRVIA